MIEDELAIRREARRTYTRDAQGDVFWTWVGSALLCVAVWLTIAVVSTQLALAVRRAL
jgi:hypothetical protein